MNDTPPIDPEVLASREAMAKIDREWQEYQDSLDQPDEYDAAYEAARIQYISSPLGYDPSDTSQPALADLSIPIKASPLRPFKPNELQERQWLYGTHLIRKYTSMTVAAAGTGKSTLAMLDGMSVASGQGIIGTYVHEQANVWIYNLEDPLEEMEKRFAAACLHYKLEHNEFDGKLFLNSGRDRELKIMERAGAGYIMPDQAGLIAAIKANNVGLLIVDPFISSYEGDENSNKDIDKAVKAFNAVADATNCAIELIHHTGKQQNDAGGQNSGRGGSAMVGAVRVLRTLMPMTTEEASLYGVKEDDRFQYIRNDGAKANMSKRTHGTMWFRIIGQYLDNGIKNNGRGDEIAVMQQWRPAGVFDGITTSQIIDCLYKLNQGVDQDRYSFDARSKQLWAVNVIMPMLNVDERRAKAILFKWKEEHIVYQDEYKNADSKTRLGLFVNMDKAEQL